MNPECCCQPQNRLALSSRFIPGLLLSLAVALASLWLGQQPWFAQHALSSLTLAILLGALLGNLLPKTTLLNANSGVGLAKKYLLQLGIVLYGLGITLGDLAQVGWRGLVIDLLVLASTFSLAWLLGRKLLRMEAETVVLIGAGSSICGAAAVLATEPVVKGRAEQVAVAVATVLVFGSLATLAYPMAYAWNLEHQWLPVNSHAFGLFTGSTVHEVAQVVAAAKTLGEAGAHGAVIEKMGRVILLAPFLLLLGALWQRRAKAILMGTGKGANPEAGQTERGKITIPWFALGFVLVIVLNTYLPLNTQLKTAALQLDQLLLALAMAALGLNTHWQQMRQAGFKPLLLAGVLFAWLVLGGGAINFLLH